MWLNKDGSGRYDMVFDMSGMMKSGLFDMIEQMAESDSTGMEISSQMPEHLDSVMYFKDLPDSIMQRFTQPEVVKRTQMHIQIDKGEGLMKMTVRLDFKNMTEVNYLLNNLDKIQGGQKLDLPMADALGSGPLFGGKDMKLFSQSKKQIERFKIYNKEDMEDEEGLDQMKMFMSGATYSTIYHLPGKVKKVSNKNAKIDGKTVDITVSLLDLLTETATSATTIRYK